MPPRAPPGLPCPHPNAERDEDFLRSVVAFAIRHPDPAVLSSHDMRAHKPYLTPGHSSTSSVSSVNSLTPIYKEAPWTKPGGASDPESASVTSSSEDNLSQAIAEDIAVLEPVERGYHRQTPFWLFSMIWCVPPKPEPAGNLN